MGGAEEKKVKVGEPGEEEGGSPKASQELVDSIEKLQLIQDELEAVRIIYALIFCEFNQQLNCCFRDRCLWV